MGFIEGLGISKPRNLVYLHSGLFFEVLSCTCQGYFSQKKLAHWHFTSDTGIALIPDLSICTIVKGAKRDSPGTACFFHQPEYEEPCGCTILLPDESRVPVFVEKGQKVNVHIYPDANRKTRAKFTGDVAYLNEYLFVQANELSVRKRTKGKTYSSFEDYASEIDGLDKELTQMLSRVKGYPDLVKEYAVQQKVDILKYKVGYVRMNPQASSEGAFIAFMNGINLNDSELFQKDPRKGSLGYGGMVEHVISWHVAQKQTPNDERGKSFVRNLEMLNNLVKAQDIRNNVSNYYALMYFMGGGNKYVNDFAQAFYKVSDDDKQISFVKNRVLSNNTLAPGSVAPDFEMRDKDGNVVNLSDLKGKFVYIDVWATWCGPCIEEIPYVASLYEKYKNDNRVVFVSISVDKDVNKWKNKIKKDSPGWPQYIVDGALESTLCKEYLISGIPRFLMFDKDGKIINANAKRPSDETFVAFLDEQLTKPKEISLPGGGKLIKLGTKKNEGK